MEGCGKNPNGLTGLAKTHRFKTNRKYAFNYSGQHVL